MENKDKRWYVCQTYSGLEKSVKQDIERRIESYNMQDLISQVLVVEETYEERTKDKEGKEKVKTKVRNLYPGYIFIEMIVTDESWFMVRNTPKVTGFLGSSGNGTKPVPIPPDEINQILKSQGIIQCKVDYNVGDKVKVIHGSFIGQIATVDTIDYEKQEVVILVDIFGQTAPMTVSISDIALA